MKGNGTQRVQRILSDGLSRLTSLCKSRNLTVGITGIQTAIFLRSGHFWSGFLTTYRTTHYQLTSVTQGPLNAMAKFTYDYLDTALLCADNPEFTRGGPCPLRTAGRLRRDHPIRLMYANSN